VLNNDLPHGEKLPNLPDQPRQRWGSYQMGVPNPKSHKIRLSSVAVRAMLPSGRENAAVSMIVYVVEDDICQGADTPR
jgi:hypothetical protein